MRKKMSDYLPEELVEDILTKLPVKSILKFSCVCKLWNSIIIKPDFISKQVQTTFSSNKHGHLLLHYFNENDYCSLKSRCFLRRDRKDFTEYMSVHPLFQYPLDFGMAGSCNGLVCLVNGSYEIILWNPSIKKTMLLPTFNFSQQRYRNLFGIGFDSKNNDFKVIRIMVNDYRSNEILSTDAFLYSLSSNSWKKIANITCGKYGKSRNFVTPEVLKDALYWPVIQQGKNLILVFNLHEEVFREISLPECLVNFDKREVTIKAYKESSIAVIDQKIRGPNICDSHLWVLLKEENCEWIKIATIGNRWKGMSKVLAFRNNGEALVHYTDQGCLVSYNMQKKRFNLLPLAKHDSMSSWDIQYDSISAHKYVDSLALFDTGKNVTIDAVYFFR